MAAVQKPVHLKCAAPLLEYTNIQLCYAPPRAKQLVGGVEWRVEAHRIRQHPRKMRSNLGYFIHGLKDKHQFNRIRIDGVKSHETTGHFASCNYLQSPDF